MPILFPFLLWLWSQIESRRHIVSFSRIIIINFTCNLTLWTRYLIFLIPAISDTKYFWEPIFLRPNISETQYFWYPIFQIPDILLYNGEIRQSVSQWVPPFFEQNQNGHKSVNFQARTPRFCMEVHLEDLQMMMMTRRRMTTRWRTTTGVSQLWD